MRKASKVFVTIEVENCGSCPFYYVLTFGMFPECTAIDIKPANGRIPDGFIVDETIIPKWCPFL